MSLDAYLNQRCTIKRDVTTTTDRYNNAAKSEVVMGTNVHCRKTAKAMRVIDPKTAEYAFVYVDLILLPSGSDVQPLDEIEIGKDKWRVTQPLIRQRGNALSHLSVMVEAINV